jgi:hypothetical protein
MLQLFATNHNTPEGKNENLKVSQNVVRAKMQTPAQPSKRFGNIVILEWWNVGSKKLTKTFHSFSPLFQSSIVAIFHTCFIGY